MVVGAAAVSARPSEDSPLQFSETAAPAAVDKSTDPSSSAIESIITAGDGSENDPNATVDLRHHHRPYYGGTVLRLQHQSLIMDYYSFISCNQY